MNLLPLTIAFPLAGFLVLAFFYRLPDRVAAFIGVLTLALSALTTLFLDLIYFQGNTLAVTQHLWTWIAVGDFTPGITLHLDGLSLTMVNVVTGVGFLIFLFASWYMREDLAGERGMTRFFAYMNLFVVSMLILVLGNNLLLIFFGWEGVGLCSYLLIGYYYKNRTYAWAAYKAFIMSRIGDVCFAIAMFVIFATFHTLNVQELAVQMPVAWHAGDPMAEIAALLLLGGAVGKSAQLPLQTWLPDAMAGPTPVSALIHAATMVTAGVYLIARMHFLYELAPIALEVVAIVGALTLLIAGFAALAQTDIKRVLAYSTMSQIGYMFLALGVGAWDAAIFHLMIHAFFKALLFLASGSVIIACHHEQDMFKMGGLWKTLKLDYVVFLIGGGALSALPIVTAGFYSKDEILWQSFASGHVILWIGALLGALLTSIYTFRMIFITFHGKKNTDANPGRGLAHHIPLIVLAILSTFVGAFLIPPVRAVLSSVLPGGVNGASESLHMTIEIASVVVALVGLGIAAALFLGSRERITRATATPLGTGLWRYWFNAWGFDWLYDRVLVRPYRALSALHRGDWVNSLVNTIPYSAVYANHRLSRMHNGQLRWYVLTVACAAVLLLAWLVLV